ncbi:MAG: hypothetical protein UW18_C0002G0116 [Microgenomates group bacterium GW2011_GWF1_44_10]|nr:MAG: hypothetical protein UW18_C0002G0116 [Microgenomates group bacterium GW2011_GWF1_44_10]
MTKTEKTDQEIWSEQYWHEFLEFVLSLPQS